MYAVYPCISVRDCSRTFEPMTLWSQGNSIKTAPGLPFCLVLFGKLPSNFPFF
jgi:hypothetical protein